MSRRANSLYIGDEFLTVEGRSIKHTGLIKEYGNINIKKITDKPMKFYGLDLETNHKTAELKLLGLYDGENYAPYYDNFLTVLFGLIKKAYWEKGETALVWWNKLDPFVLYKQFLELFPKDKAYKSMARYGKVGGRWNDKEGKWSVKPVIQVEIDYGNKTYRFGIESAIRSSIKYFFYEMVGGSPKKLDNGLYPISTVWAYDVAGLYKFGLEKEMLSRADIFPYYSKVSKDAHLVDWDKFYNDRYYRNNVVLYSNMLDARAVYDLANLVQNQFKNAFGYYPRNLISAGSIARASIVATIQNKHKAAGLEDSALAKKVKEDVKSIGIINYRDEWSTQLGEDKLKDLFCLFFEAYSGGYIEVFRYGMIEAGYSADLAGAYIYHLQQLMDLRGSKVTTGEGAPPTIPNSYCFVRGIVNIPLHLNYFSLTVKHITKKDTNVRAAGTYRASYTINERKYLEKMGATFEDETWYNVETTGKKSVLAEVVTDLTDLRFRLVEQGDSSEYLVKTASASIYGITFEATPTHYEDDTLEIKRTGYRSGEFMNSLYAAWVTSETRLQMSQAGQEVEEAGGRPVLMMTDCLFWEGTANMLNPATVRHKKTLGFFETPQPFNSMACLGTGRYSYVDDNKGYVTTKNRGLNITDIHDENGKDMGEYNWIEVLKLAEKTNSFEVMVKVRTLVSVGMVLHTKEVTTYKRMDDGTFKEYKFPIDIKDLGLILETYRKVDMLTGDNKRMINEKPKDIRKISRGSIGTSSIYYATGMLGDGKVVDQTIPILRGEVMKQEFKTAKKRDKKNRSKASYKHSSKEEVKEKILKTERDKYAYIRQNGFDRDTAKKWCKRSKERIDKELLKRGREKQ